MIVDRLIDLGLLLDKKGFTVGNIAPDCNVENEDWTEFTPPRSVTHWMNNNSKLSADYDGFYNEYIKEKSFESSEKLAFMYGYYSHLIVDVEFQNFVRDTKRIKNMYKRIKSNPELYAHLEDKSENFDTMKHAFGRETIFQDIFAKELNYINSNHDSGYNTILKNIQNFPDYIDYLPKGSIIRKLNVIKSEYNFKFDREEFYFFSKEEINDFVASTCAIIYDDFKSKAV